MSSAETLQTELAERYQALQALNDLAVHLLGLNTTAAVYEAALDGILAVMGATRGALALADAAQQEFRLATWRGYKAETQRRTDHLAYTQPAAHNHARQTGDIVVIHPDRAAPLGQDVLAGEEVETAVLLPLLHGSQVIGVLSYLVDEYRECTPFERQILRTAATYVGAALERAQLYEDAEVERARLARILELLPVGVFIAEGDAATRSIRWTLINRTGQQMIGAARITPGAVSETFTVCHPDGRPYTEDELPLQSTLWTGRPAPPQELHIRFHSGEEQVWLTGAALLSEDGGTREALVIDQDITDRKRLEDEVRRQAAALQLEYERTEAQRALLETIVEGAPVGIALYDSDLRLLNLNAEYARIARIDLAAAPGHRLYDLFPPSRAHEDLHRRVLAGEALDEENRALQVPGEEPGYYDVHYRPVRDAGGGISGLLIAVIDVTARHELDRQKDEFLSVAAHELRTPLTTIKGYAQSGLRHAGADGDERLVRALKNVDAQADRLARLINELLDVSRMESGALPLRQERFDLAEAVREVVDDLRLTASDFTLEIRTPDAPVVVHGDPQRIEQVVTNLVQNAIKYSGRSREVEVQVGCADGQAITAVRDFGVGIPAAQHAQVFERYFRGSNVASHHYGGLGLGLFIAHGIIARHGGRMWLDSTEGAGSTFYFALPLAPAA